jgi:uncharacterized protein
MRRILAIDGGGIKGMFPASFLATIEEAIGSPVVDYFDLIAGTSTGGIIALGLGLGFPAHEIVEFYEQLGPKVFPNNTWWKELSRYLAGKYDGEPLREVLTEKFGDMKLGHSTKRLIIPSVNLDKGEPYIYKTSHCERFEYDYKVKAVDVGLATSAGPTYFPPHRLEAGTTVVDGGIFANNPTGLAVVEAIGNLGWHKDELYVLSLSCTSAPVTFQEASKGHWGLIRWGSKVAELFMEAQSFASMGTAAVLMGGHNRILRICPSMQPGRFGMDTIHELCALRGLGASEARHAIPKVKEMFITDPAEPFEPFRKLT